MPFGRLLNVQYCNYPVKYRGIFTSPVIHRNFDPTRISSAQGIYNASVFYLVTNQRKIYPNPYGTEGAQLAITGR